MIHEVHDLDLSDSLLSNIDVVSNRFSHDNVQDNATVALNVGPTFVAFLVARQQRDTASDRSNCH